MQPSIISLENVHVAHKIDQTKAVFKQTLQPRCIIYFNTGCAIFPASILDHLWPLHEWCQYWWMQRDTLLTLSRCACGPPITKGKGVICRF